MNKIFQILFLLLLFNSVIGQGIINNGGLLVVASGSNVFIDGGNYLNQSNGGNHGSIDIDGNIYLTGNWTNNASSGNVFVNIEGSPDGTVHLTGSSQQALEGSASTYFENLTINNSAAGNAILISRNQNVKGTLTFSDGIIGTNANKVIVENTAVASITGHATDKYINGNLRRFTNTGSYDFPIGTLANYELIATNITTKGALSYIDASFSAVSPGAVPTGLNVDGTLISTFLDYGYWTLSPDDGATSTIDVTAVSRGHSNGGAMADQHALFKRTGAGDWENFGTHSNATQSGTLVSAITAKRTAYSNVTNNDYAIARSDANTLPIELLYFNAKCKQDSGVLLSWATSSESNNDYFTVLKSNDGKEWVELAKIDGAGNSNKVQEYSCSDQKADQHDTYYKLRQTDFDANFKEYNIVSVYCRYNHKKISLYPNPANDFVMFDFYNEHHIDAPVYVDIYNNVGVLCSSLMYGSSIDFNSHRINLPAILNSGNYFIHVRLGSEFFYTGKLIINRN